MNLSLLHGKVITCFSFVRNESVLSGVHGLGNFQPLFIIITSQGSFADSTIEN